MNEAADATAVFAPLWKKKWLILLVGLLAAAGTYVYYSHRPKVYEASTQVYLGGGTEVQTLLGNANTGTAANSHALADQAVLINSNVVQEAVTRRLLAEGNREATAGSAAATSSSESDFISISGHAGSGQAAADLVNTYAQVYLRQRTAHYRREVRAALSSTSEQLHNAEKARAKTTTQSAVIEDLVSRANELRSDLRVGNAGNQQIDPAVAPSSPISPKPTRNAIFGFVIGLALASIAAYAVSRFDRRLSSLTEIEDVIGTPIIAALPSIRRTLVTAASGEPVPAQPLREPLRRLHTTLQLYALDHGGTGFLRKVLFVSPEAGDGKSTVVAGLALVQREAGDRVVVVDSDFRRPAQAQLLGVNGERGLAEVLAGRLPLNEAMQRVQAQAPAGSTSTSSDSAITATQQQTSGSVTVLPGGGLVANPPALLASQMMPKLLDSMAADFDFVLIDAPPPLAVSDVLPLLPAADVVVVVVRARHTGETAARRLVELLKRTASAPVIGTIVNDVRPSEIEAFFGFSAEYSYKRVRSPS